MEQPALSHFGTVCIHAARYSFLSVYAMELKGFVGATVNSTRRICSLGTEFVANQRHQCRFYKMAKAIVALSTTCTGDRKPESKLNINKAVMKDSEKLSLVAIADAPAATLQGLSEEKAKLLEKMNVSTVKDLAELKYANWAEAIVALAEYEE